MGTAGHTAAGAGIGSSHAHVDIDAAWAAGAPTNGGSPQWSNSKRMSYTDLL